MRILLDIDGTIASWDTVREHGFGPASRPFDARARELVQHHEVTLFSQNPEIAAWAETLGCAFLKKPPPGTVVLELTGYEVLIDDDAEVFACHCPGARIFLSLDDFFTTLP